MTYALGYARVSTTEQADGGYSLSAQETAIRSLCLEREWELIPLYQDTASGKDRKRPGLTELLKDIKKGDVLVVAKLDRLSRSLSDFSYILDRSKKEGWNLVVIDFGLDMTTPNGELVANILMALAQWERRLISQRTKEGIRERERVTGKGWNHSRYVKEEE